MYLFLWCYSVVTVKNIIETPYIIVSYGMNLE